MNDTRHLAPKGGRLGPSFREVSEGIGEKRHRVRQLWSFGKGEQHLQYQNGGAGWRSVSVEGGDRKRKALCTGRGGGVDPGSVTRNFSGWKAG